MHTDYQKDFVYKHTSQVHRIKQIIKEQHIIYKKYSEIIYI